MVAAFVVSVLLLGRISGADAFVAVATTRTINKRGGVIQNPGSDPCGFKNYGNSCHVFVTARVPTHLGNSGVNDDSSATASQKEGANKETAIDFALTMNRLCLLMILVSYLPWPRADPETIPKYYQSGVGKKIYERLKVFVQPLQDKIDDFSDGVTQQELNDLLFSESPDSTRLLKYMRRTAKKCKTKWSGELLKQKGVLENFRPRQNDGTLVFLRPEEQDPNKVFAIVANHKLKRMTLVFRGSQNLGDWLTDIQAAMAYEKMKKYEIRVGIHKGFYKRLTEPDDVFGIVTLFALVRERLCDAVPTDAKGKYSLVVTGHSLGGAMATVAGLLAAQDPLIATTFGGPVTVLSLAAPRVGNHNFRRLHQHLEQTGRLQHLRCMNDDDIVPTIPYKNIFGKGAYTHVGLRWVLHQDKDSNEAHVTMAYPDVMKRNSPASFWGKASNHYTWIYRDRLLSLYKKQGAHPDLQLSMDALFKKYLNSVSDPL